MNYLSLDHNQDAFQTMSNLWLDLADTANQTIDSIEPIHPPGSRLTESWRGYTAGGGRLWHDTTIRCGTPTDGLRPPDAPLSWTHCHTAVLFQR